MTGELEDLDKITIEAMKAWWKEHVRPENAVFYLAGDITPTRDLGRNLAAWVLGCATVYLALFGTGKLLLREPGLGALLLAGAVARLALHVLVAGILRGVVARGLRGRVPELVGRVACLAGSLGMAALLKA